MGRRETESRLHAEEAAPLFVFGAGLIVHGPQDSRFVAVAAFVEIRGPTIRWLRIHRV